MHVATDLFQLFMQFSQWRGRLIATFDSFSPLFHETLRLLTCLCLSFPHRGFHSLAFFLLHPFLFLRKFPLKLSGAFTQSMSNIRQPCLSDAFRRLVKRRDSSAIFCELSFWTVNFRLVNLRSLARAHLSTTFHSHHWRAKIGWSKIRSPGRRLSGKRQTNTWMSFILWSARSFLCGFRNCEHRDLNLTSCSLCGILLRELQLFNKFSQLLDVIALPGKEINLLGNLLAKVFRFRIRSLGAATPR